VGFVREPGRLNFMLSRAKYGQLAGISLGTLRQQCGGQARSNLARFFPSPSYLVPTGAFLSGRWSTKVPQIYHSP
jgi:hypothetical protein